MKTTYKVKRLRDGAELNLGAAHALNLLRENARLKKPEFELVEKNYTFSNDEIHKKPNTRNSKDSEV